MTAATQARIDDIGTDLVFDGSTEGARAFERYAALYAAGADVERDGSSFFAAVSAQLLPGVTVFSRDLRGVRHQRDRSRVRRDAFDHFTLQTVLAGSMRLDADGDERQLGPGDAVFLDMTRPFRHVARGRVLTISVARERMRETGLDLAALHGAPWAAGPGLGRLLSGAKAGDPDVADAVIDFLARARRATPPSQALRLRRRRERALAFIEANLANEALSPAMVAVATGMSRATLYRAFESLGGVSEWLQNRRLRRARSLLVGTDLSVAEAGRCAGFGNPSHLSFAFQSRFGDSPSAFRRAKAVQLARSGPLAATALHDMPLALTIGGLREAA